MAARSNPADRELFKAIEARSAEGVRAALAGGASPNATQGKQKALDLAFRWRVPDDGLHALIDAGADLGGGTPHVVWAATQPLPLLEKVLAAGADVNAESFAGRPVQVAARAGLLPQVERLLAAGADPDLGTMIGNALTDAITRGHAEVALALVKGGATLQAAEKFGPMLAMVIETGDVTLAKALIAAAPDVDTRATLRGPHTRVKLQEAGAARARLGAGLKRIVEAGAALGKALSGEVPEPATAGSDGEEGEDDRESFEDFEKRINAEISARAAAATRVRFSGATPLMIAASEGSVEIVDALLSRGALMDLVDDEGRTALRIAEASGHARVVERLRAAGASPEATIAPLPALMLAAEKGDPAEVEAAVRAGADVNAYDTRKATDGRTALIIASERGRLEIVRALLRLGADHSLRAKKSPNNLQAFLDNDSQERTALHAAAAAGHDRIATDLLDAGAAVDPRDENKETPLFLAAMNDRLPTVRLLISRGADVNAKGRDGMTPLLYAAARGHAEIGVVLLEAGADATAASRDKESALHRAVSSNALPLVKELVSRGADPLAKNKYGATPKERGAHIPKIAAILEAGGAAKKPTGTGPKKKKKK